MSLFAYYTIYKKQSDSKDSTTDIIEASKRLGEDWLTKGLPDRPPMDDPEADEKGTQASEIGSQIKSRRGRPRRIQKNNPAQ